MITEALFDDFASDTASWLTGLYTPEFPIADLGSVANDVSKKLRMLACFRLLAHGNADSFYHNLIRSGMARRHYLQRCIASGALSDHFRGCGRFQPLCDAMAAGDFTLAAEIAAFSPVEFLEHHEYEDDYCYGRILHSMVSNVTVDTAAILDRFLAYRDGVENGRILVATALVNREQATFSHAFEQLLHERQLEINADVERGEMESPHVITARRVYVEGLAILKLAERVGLETEDEYLYCPSLARVPMVKPFPGE